MASDDPNNRSVADYFVVAGLPTENPQLLDEHSLEINLKPSARAYQDPITDIAVIFPSLGENVPDYYQMVEQTPGGHSADLNSGSFRAPEVFVCFRRGRERPPLLDIGVLYDGKERVTPDSQIVEFTPNGHSANVNNTHNSAVYLTYRRATEVSPPNEKVVVDLCVIVTTKGDDVPHGFKKIDKTLNKGMVGSDVYICYKKSMNRPDLISYKPGLLSRLPLKNNPSYRLEDIVALFCLPMGATLECWPSASSRPAAAKSTFVLTLASREKVYGTAITFYEEYDEDKLSEEQREMLQLSKKWTRKSDRKILANKAICVLSRWPFFEAFKSFLFFLHKRQLMGPFDIPLERFISHFLYDVPFPSPERPRILVQLCPQEKIALFQPEELPLPRSGASFRHMLANLGPENCLLVLFLALTEQTILIHSFRPDVLTSVAEAVMQIIFPFYWQCPYIPLCPIGMSNYLAAPLPVVIGLDSRFFDLYEQPDDVNAVDLDTNTITLASSLRDFASTKLLPKKPAKQLRSTLEVLLEKLAMQVKIARELEAHNDETIDFVFKMKKPEMLLEMEIREAFLSFMVSILSGYKSFLLPIKAMPTVGATDVANLFNQSGFLASRDKNYHKFYNMLMQTQMFTKFIEERSFVSDTNTALAFFDECMDNFNGTDHDHNRYLELEFPDSDRTVFIMPPDNSGLPPDSEYKYENFEELNPDLFEDKSELMKQESDGFDQGPPNQANFQAPGTSVFATPASTIARRTKQEIKSAQKSAKKTVEHPFHWAKFLVNTTYSLWFIHMPAFMLFNKALLSDPAKALRMGIIILQRMRRLRLFPVEEICFRVMMHLCGVHHQPQIAMAVMNEMNLMGMSPNAVTYGYYNKAVLESVWPETKEPTKAVKLWQKLGLVLEVVRRFRQCGIEAQTVNSFARERQQSKNANGVAPSTSLRGSKNELDNVSRSSQESGLSRLSATTSNDTAVKNGNGSAVHDSLDANTVTETPATGTKNMPRYSEIRGRFSNLLGSSSSKPTGVNRVLFSDENKEGNDEEIEIVQKSRSQSVDSSDDGMMMGDPVVLKDESRLPPVPEAEPQIPTLLMTPPKDLQRVGSASLIKIPVTDNDPLGALASPTNSLPKSATANDLLVNNKRPSLEANILGAPFSASNMEMSRSSTLPLDSEAARESMSSGTKSYFSMASIKSITTKGTSKLSSIKKTAYLTSAAGAWMSPSSKESLNKGLTSLKSVYSSAATTISKRVEEYREQSTPSRLEAAGSNLNLADEDSLSVTSTEAAGRRPSDYVDQPDSWSNLTGQLWDQLWSYSYDSYVKSQNQNQNQNQPPRNLKSFADLFEELYSALPRCVVGPVAMELNMTSCSKCKNCGSILYDEEIIAGWTAEDSNLNTRCPFCNQMVVPFLTIKVIDLRGPADNQNPLTPFRIELTPIQVPYLSPLVLRKELESILEREGDVCLGDNECVDNHPIIYWNLVWFFERIGLKSHLPGLSLRAPSLNNKESRPDPDPCWNDADHRNVAVKIHWDNEMFNAETGVPLYLQFRQKEPNCDAVVKMICDGVQQRDLFFPLKNLLDSRPNSRSIYREMMFVTLEMFGQENIDLTAFDREYRRAFDRLPLTGQYGDLLTPSDRPPTPIIVLCRKFFRELKI